MPAAYRRAASSNNNRSREKSRACGKIDPVELPELVPAPRSIRVYFAQRISCRFCIRTSRVLRYVISLHAERPVKTPLAGGLQINDGGMLLDVIEEKEQTGSIIITTQFPIEKWHLKLPDPTVADAICDRLTHTAIRFYPGWTINEERKRKIPVKMTGSVQEIILCQ